MLPIAQNQTQWRWQYGDVRKLIEKKCSKGKTTTRETFPMKPTI